MNLWDNSLFGYAAYAAPWFIRGERDFFALPEDVRAAVEAHRDEIRTKEDLEEFLQNFELKK